jgi:hypothetical protein
MRFSAFFRSRLGTHAAKPTLFGLSLVVAIAGCQPKIGDSCVTSIDCSQTGARLCDGSQPGGYCTIFNCDPDKCPDNSVCVGFGNQIDPVCGSIFDPRSSRFERTFCMKACETSTDCREGYVCDAPSARRSVSIDILSDWRDFKVCFPAQTEQIASVQPPPSCFDTTVSASVGSGPGTSSASTGSGVGGSGATSSSTTTSGTTSSSSASSASAGGAGGSGGS